MRTIKLFALGSAVLLVLSCSDRTTEPKPAKRNVKASAECSGVVIRVGNQGDTTWVCQQ